MLYQSVDSFKSLELNDLWLILLHYLCGNIIIFKNNSLLQQSNDKLHPVLSSEKVDLLKWITWAFLIFVQSYARLVSNSILLSHFCNWSQCDFWALKAHFKILGVFLKTVFIYLWQGFSVIIILKEYFGTFIKIYHVLHSSQKLYCLFENSVGISWRTIQIFIAHHELDKIRDPKIFFSVIVFSI